jgi:guanine nucleotide-binding protein subunit alpha
MEPTEEVNREYAEMIMEYRLEADTYSTANPAFASNGAFDGGLSPDFVQAVDSLWHDPIIPSVMDRSSEFYLMDSAP